MGNNKPKTMCQSGQKIKLFKASTITFTSYKTEEETIKALHEDGCQWYLYGLETCPSTGRQHL